jgi:2,2-dialkylglycine decarboxylase (pyruvate)
MQNNKTSLALWEKYGEYLLMAMPYADGLITEAQGCILRDADGNEVLDLAAGQFCSILGHNHPKLIQRITEQMQKVLHIGTQFLSPVVLEAAAKFAEVAPSKKLRKSLFLSTGTEANECAISIAKMYTGKTGIAGISRGYYGLSLATKSLSTIFTGEARNGDTPRVPDTYNVMAPYCYRCPVQQRYPECNIACIQASIDAGMAGGNNLAAVIVEPIISAGGMIVPPPGYLKALKEFCRAREALLIVDEAQTGFGRTGKWFAIQHHEDVEPDILVISKSAGAGFPVSGLITTDEIADRITSLGFHHLASHQTDPAAAAAVSAMIDVVREENLVQAAAQNGAYFMERLRELQAKHPIILDVRGQGLMIGVELKPQDDFDVAFLTILLCKRRGVHLTYTYFEPVLRFIPPLTLTREQIDTAIAALDGAFSDISSRNFSMDELLPKNRFSREYVEKLSGKRTLGRILSRLYSTSPEKWVKKLVEAAGKRGN